METKFTIVVFAFPKYAVTEYVLYIISKIKEYFQMTFSGSSVVRVFAS